MERGNGLKELIAEKGFRIDFLAKQIGLSAGTLRLIASGRRKTSLPVIKLLSQNLQVSEEQLIKMGLLHEAS